MYNVTIMGAKDVFLVLVCIVQIWYCVVMFWDVTNPVDTESIGLLERSSDSSFTSKQKSETSVNTISYAEASKEPKNGYANLKNVPVSYKGVAATVMLHSPKWFQRRYTNMIQNIVNNLPENWALQIFYIPSGGSLSGLAINPGIGKMISAKKVILTPMPEHVAKGKKRRSDYFLDLWLWTSMLADTVLLFGGNSVICSNSKLLLDNFTSYDYIGSPWKDHGGYGGGGEISIRNKNLMIEIILDKLKTSGITKDFTDAWGLEDHFFVKSILQLMRSGRQLKIASFDESLLFASADSFIDENSFAASGTLGAATDVQRESFFAYCPELKLIFPSLHNPACFGASPNPEKCALSICALNKDRKGGC